jgi:myo-inositol 2-dehydrogenase/D-chiro-inositol 1-dehydrogenase
MKIKIGIIGAGGIARTHVAALRELEQVRISGIHDVQADRARELAEECGANAYTDLDDLIASSDAVYILTPPSTRRSIALRVASAGKPMFIEKPVAVSLEDAEAIEEACRKAGIPAMVGFNMRFRAGYRHLKNLIESGELGDVISLWSHRIDRMWPGSSWRTDPRFVCGMTIESLSHDIDMFRWLCGEVVNVSASVVSTRHDLPGFDDNANVLLTLQGGATAVIQASLSAHLNLNNRGVIGTRGTAMLTGSGTWHYDRLVYRTADMEEAREDPLDDPLDVRSYRAIGEHFVESLLGGVSPAVTLQDGIIALRVAHAIHESSRRKSVIDL